jgi:hypothetical protein
VSSTSVISCFTDSDDEATAPPPPSPPPAQPQAFDTSYAWQQSDRQIIHELALDKDFQLTRLKRSRLEAIVEDSAKTTIYGTLGAE